MAAIPANPAHGYGFGMGTRCCTCTYTQAYLWAKPGQVLKPMPITSNKTKSMSQILTQCKEKNTQLIWLLAKSLWPYRNISWPKITLGTILGCSSISLQPIRPGRDNRQRRQTNMHQGCKMASKWLS